MRWIIPLLLLTGACAPQQFVDHCAGYGYAPGTEAYAACRMQVDLAEQQRRNNILNAYIGSGALRGPSTTSCQRFGTMVNCTSR